MKKRRKERTKQPRRRKRRRRRIPPLPLLVSCADAENLTGVGYRRLHQLATEGFFPMPREKIFELAALIKGIVAYYRDEKNRHRQAVDKLRAVKLERETQKIDLELRKMEGQTLEMEAVNEFLLHVSALQKTVLYSVLAKEYPPRITGKTQAEATVLGRETADKICEIFRGKMSEWLKSLQS